MDNFTELSIDNFTTTRTLAGAIKHILVKHVAGATVEEGIDEIIARTMSKTITAIVHDLKAAVLDEGCAVALPPALALLDRIRTKDGADDKRRKLSAWITVEQRAYTLVNEAWQERETARRAAVVVEPAPKAKPARKPRAKKTPVEAAPEAAPVVVETETEPVVEDDIIDVTPSAPQPIVVVNQGAAPDGIDQHAWDRASPSGRRRLIAKSEKQAEKQRARAAKQAQLAAKVEPATSKRQPLVTPELKALSLEQLRAKHRELFGRDTNATHRIVLFHVATGLRNLSQGLSVDDHLTRWKKTAAEKRGTETATLSFAKLAEKIARLNAQLAAMSVVPDMPKQLASELSSAGARLLEAEEIAKRIAVSEQPQAA